MIFLQVSCVSVAVSTSLGPPGGGIELALSVWPSPRDPLWVILPHNGAIQTEPDDGLGAGVTSAHSKRTETWDLP